MYDEETEQLSEDVIAATGKVADLTKVASNGYAGISLWKDAAQTEYKSLKDYLGEIAEIWDEIDAASQTQLLDKLFGKRGASVGSAILGNFKQVEKSIEAMEDAAGAAGAEMSIIEQSIDFKLNALKQTWVGVLQELMDNGMLGDLIDGVTKLSEALGNLITTIGPLPTLVAAIGLSQAIPRIDKIVEFVRDITKVQTTSRVLDTTTATLTELANASLNTADGMLYVEESTTKLGTALKFLISPAGLVVAALAAVAVALLAAKKANDELRKSATKLSSQFKEAKSDIADYKDEIIELQETINDENVSYEDSKTARERLLAIQDELIEKYGKEAESIKLITDAIGGEVDALDKLTDKQWQQAINTFNEQNLKGWDWLNRVLHGASDNVGVMLSDIENQIRQVTFAGADKKLADELAEAFGGHVTAGSGNSYILSLSGNLDELHDKILDIQTIARDRGAATVTISSLSNVESKMNDLLEQYESFYRLYNLNERIMKDANYEEAYTIMTSEYEKYRKAIKEQNDEAAKESKDAIVSQFTGLWREMYSSDGFQADETGIFKTLEELFPELQAEIDKNVLLVKLEVGEAEIKDDVINAITAFGSTEAIQNYKGGDNNLDAYLNIINEQLKACNLSLEDYIDYLQKAGKLQGFQDRDAIGAAKKFEEAVGRITYDGNTGIRTVSAEYVDAINALTDEEYQDYLLLNNEYLKKIPESMKKIQDETSENIDETELYKEAIQDVLLEWKSVQKEVEDISFNTTAFSEDIENIGKLQTEYDKFVKAYEEHKSDSTTKFSADLEDIEKLRADSKDNPIFGDLESFDAFEKIVTSDISTFEQIQNAYDQLLTEYARNQFALEGLDNETKEMIRTQLEMKGVTHESAQAFVEQAYNIEELQKKLEKLDFSSYLNKARENLSEDSGEEGVIQLATDAIEVYNELKKKAAEGTLDITDLTAKEIQVLQNEGIIASETGQYLATLALKKQLLNISQIQTAESVNALAALAQQAGIDIAELTVLKKLLDLIAARDSAAAQGYETAYWDARIDEVKNNLVSEIQNALGDVQLGLNFNPVVKDAAKGGKDSGDAWVEAYEKELQKLDDLKDQGLISEKEYLNRLKALIDKYFKDRAKYAEKYAQEMQKYLDKMLEHYNSVISGVTTLLDKRINKLNKNKDSIVKTLQEEQKAAEESIQARIDAIQDELDAIDDQKEALDEQIDGINKEIDKYNDMIDAINEANDARQREINLSKALYELQRAQNQRTKLVYTGEKSQMRYERDESAVRDAKEQVKQAEDEITIANIEKQIKLLEDEIELIEKQKKALEDREKILSKEQEALQKQLESTTKYYEKLIEQQEKLYDDQVEALEKIKEQWEELAAVDEIAKAWGLVEDEMTEMGYTVEDVLNGNEAAFNAFKDRYVALLKEMHSGDEGYLNGLKETTKEVPGQYEKIAKAAADAKQPIEELGTTSETASNGVSSLGSSASSASSDVGELSSKAESLTKNVTTLSQTDLTGLKDALKDIVAHLKDIDGVDVTGLVQSLKDMDDYVDDGLVIKVSDLADALIAIGEVILTSIVADLEKMKNLADDTTTANYEKIADSIGEMSTYSVGSLIGEFTSLQSLISPIATALTGENGLVSALNELQNIKLDSTIIAQFNALKDAINAVTNATNGSGAGQQLETETGKEKEENASHLVGAIEEVKQATTENIGVDSEETGDTAIGHFNALGQTIETVAKDKIGISDEEGNNENPETLIGTIGGLKDTVDIKIPEVISQFDAFKDKISECIQEVEILIEKLNSIHLPVVGSANDNQSSIVVVDSQDYTGTAIVKRAPKLKGSAKFTGDWGVKRNETSLVGELGTELVVDSKTGTFRTVGDKGPELTKLHKGDLVYNHKQTQAILSKRNQVKKKKGPAHMDGTLPTGFFKLTESVSYSKLQGKIRDYGIPTLDGIRSAFESQTTAIRNEIQQIAGASANRTTNVTQHNAFYINGVSGEDVARQINNTLVNTFTGMSVNAYQRALT